MSTGQRRPRERRSSACPRPTRRPRRSSTSRRRVGSRARRSWWTAASWRSAPQRPPGDAEGQKRVWVTAGRARALPAQPRSGGSLPLGSASPGSEGAVAPFGAPVESPPSRISEGVGRSGDHVELGTRIRAEAPEVQLRVVLDPAQADLHRLAVACLDLGVLPPPRQDVPQLLLEELLHEGEVVGDARLPVPRVVADALGALRDRHAAGGEILHQRRVDAGLALEGSAVAMPPIGTAPRLRQIATRRRKMFARKAVVLMSTPKRSGHTCVGSAMTNSKIEALRSQRAALSPAA